MASSNLLDENGAKLLRADLPRHPADKARGHAESSSRGTADRAIDPLGAELKRATLFDLTEFGR